MKAKRKRMIFDLPDYVRMAIKLRSIKNNLTTGEVVAAAIEQSFPRDVESAHIELEKQRISEMEF